MSMNAFEIKARARKAHALSVVLDATGLADADLEGLRSVERESFAAKAGVRPPSDETWSLACTMVRNARAIRTSDPFAGL